MFLKQKGDADSSLKRGLSSIVDSIKRIRIAAGGTTSRDFERYDDFERIDIDGSKIYVTSDPEETYVCNTKFEPHIPSPSRRETLVDMDGNKYEPLPVAGELYNPDSATSVTEKVGPIMGGSSDIKGGIAVMEDLHIDLDKPNTDGCVIDEDVDVSDLFDGTFIFGMEPVKTKDKIVEPEVPEAPVLEPETHVVEAPVEVPEAPVVVPELPGKVEAPVLEPETHVVEAPVEVPEAPVVEPELPGKVEAPVVEPETPVVEAPVEVPEAPVVETVVPVVEPETPVVEAPVEVPEAPVVEAPVVETVVPVVEPEAPVVEAPVVETVVPVVVPVLPSKVEAPVEVPEITNAVDDNYDDEVITFGNDTKSKISTVDDSDKIIDSEIGITKKAMEDQNAALTKAVEDIVDNVGDVSTDKVEAVDSFTARPEDMVEHKIEDAVVIDTSTQKIVFDTVKPVAPVAVPGIAEVPVVVPEVKKSELVLDAMSSKTETSDIPNRVTKTKKAKTIGSKSKKYYMNDCYYTLSDPTTHRPLRFTGGNLVDTEVPARPPRRESKRKVVSEYTLTKDTEEKKEERQTLNSIMARSVEEPKLVVPKARRLVLQPIKIEDEVEDVMRLSVPNFDAEDFGEEDFACCPEDGIEETLFESESKNDSQVVFSFGGDGYGDEGIMFYFGH